MMLALFGAAGSAARARTRSVFWTVVAGAWCAAVGMPIALGYAFTANYLFADHVAARLQEPFAASGLSDAGAFVLRNSLVAASEALVRMPVAALAVSFVGGLANAWVAARSRGLAVVAAWLTPLVLAAGAPRFGMRTPSSGPHDLHSSFQGFSQRE